MPTQIMQPEELCAVCKELHIVVPVDEVMHRLGSDLRRTVRLYTLLSGLRATCKLQINLVLNFAGIIGQVTCNIWQQKHVSG